VTVNDSTVLPRSPTDVRRPRVSGNAGYTRSIATSCKRKPFGDVISIKSHDYQGNVGNCHRRRRSRLKPAAACATRASRMHGIRNMPLAGSPAVANRPAEAAQCLESRASTRPRVYHPNAPELAKTFCAQSRPIPIRDQSQLEVGWARLARAKRLAPTISWTSRGRMRGAGATCTAATTHAGHKRMTVLEYGKIGAG
jgi:hypothetical protein